MKIEVFDPPMCCSSGVCGAKVDPELVRVAADLDALKQQGVEVQRYNLGQQPTAFTENETVRHALTADPECLPLVLVNGQIMSQGEYPSAQALADALGLQP